MAEQAEATRISQLKDHYGKHLSGARYSELCAECTALIAFGDDLAYLGYLYRASAWLMSGEFVGPELLVDVQRGMDLAGDDPERRADGLFMALAVYVHVASRPIIQQTAAKLLALVDEHPVLAKYRSRTHQMLGMEAMSRQAWGEMLRRIQTANEWVSASVVPEVERPMLRAQAAIAYLALGDYEAAAASVEEGIALDVGFGCVRYALDCMAAVVAVLQGGVPTIPTNTRPERAADLYRLLACAVADACGFASPVPDPAAALRDYIASANMFAFLGLVSWVESLGKGESP